MKDRIVQAYEPKQYYKGGRYIIVGSGIASVNEWANCIEAGAQCIALRRNPHPDQQDLNVPRCLFDGSGIDAFQGLDFDARVDFLGKALKGTAPTRRNWSEIIRSGREAGLFEEVIGSVTDIQPGPAGLKTRLKLYDGTDVGDIDVTGVVVGTGFVKSALALPVIRRLAQTYGVPIERERIKLKLNCGVPPLDRPGLAPRRDGPGLEHDRAERRHDHRPQVPGPPLRRRLLPGRGHQGALAPVALPDAGRPGQRHRQGDPSASEDRAARLGGGRPETHVPHPYRPNPHAHGDDLPAGAVRPDPHPGHRPPGLDRRSSASTT